MRPEGDFSWLEHGGSWLGDRKGIRRAETFFIYPQRLCFEKKASYTRHESMCHCEYCIVITNADLLSFFS